MLNKEILKANEALASLTDEQLATIEKLSANDEHSVIGAKIGEIHRQYDETILKATGVERDGDEKSYKYLERAGSMLREKVAASSQAEEKAKKLEMELQEARAKGGTDEALKEQYSNLKAELDQTKKQYTGLQGKFTEAQKEHEQKMFGMQVDFELGRAATGLKLKADLPESAAKVLMQQAVAGIKKNKADFIDNGEGGKRLVFRNESGAVLNNPENKLNPYTAAELLAAELKGMGVLDTGREQKGGGTLPVDKGRSSAVDIAGAKTQVEANEVIMKQLASRGLVRGSAEFEKATTKAWTENKIGDLPEK